jgi:fructose-1,6-bisphosphatase/inositol monophosphatase family enzyme
MALVDMDRVADLLAEVAETEVMPRWRNLEDGHVRAKTGPTDLVTIADEAAERMLTARLSDVLPGSVVVGEEAVAADPQVLDRLKGDAPVWIVDPVDGTNNFAKGDEKFAIMVALARADETLAAWILEPVSGRTIMAAKGEGAEILSAEGRHTLRVARSAPLSEMTGSYSLRFLPEGLKKPARDAATEALGHHYRLGCAGVEYLKLATAQAHFSFYWKTMPWDHAPGLLIHAEAGGHNGRAVDGRPYKPSEMDGGLLSAPDIESWQALREGPVRVAVGQE